MSGDYGWSRRSQGPPPPRRQLIEEFCRAMGWCDAHREDRRDSASAALRWLERCGPVRPPRIAPRQEAKGPRYVGWR
jgi:hypothetical protein